MRNRTVGLKHAPIYAQLQIDKIVFWAVRVQVDECIERWQAPGGSEMATAQSFAIELTELLGVPRPNVSNRNGEFLNYRFERPVTLTHIARKRNGRIDRYKKDHFILEAKQFVSQAPNKERTEEEALGHVRWLRPEYQNPTGVQAASGKSADMDLGVTAKFE